MTHMQPGRALALARVGFGQPASTRRGRRQSLGSALFRGGDNPVRNAAPHDRLKRALTAFVRQPVDFSVMLASKLRNVRQRPVKPYLCDPHWEARAAHATWRTAALCGGPGILAPLGAGSRRDDEPRRENRPNELFRLE